MRTIERTAEDSSAVAKEGETRMTVGMLIRQLEKVEHKEADVYLDNSPRIDYTCKKVIIEHDLATDEIIVVLK